MIHTKIVQTKNHSNQLYLFLVFTVMASSSIVFFEPAPIDLGVIILLSIGLLFQKLEYSYSTVAVPSLFLFLFLLATLISMFSILHLQVGIKDWMITLYLLLSFYLYTGLIAKFGDIAIRTLMNGYTFAAFLAATIGIASYFHLIPWSDFLMKADRIKGFFKDPNVFGPFLIPVALYAYAMLEMPKKKKKYWWLLVLLILATGIFLSYSRAAWGNFILSMLIYFILRFLKDPSIKILMKFSLTLLILYGAFQFILSVPFVNDMFIERFEIQSYDDGRFNNQSTASQIAIANPIGLGPGQYEATIGFATHNTFLRVLVDNGLIGLIGFSGFILATLLHCLRLITVSKNPIFLVIFASAIGILLNSLVVDTLHWRHFWLIFAIPWGFKYTDVKKSFTSDKTSV